MALLIADRAEIACRIARTARAMGHRTLAVFTDPDANALHVRRADAAVRIASYLDIRALIDAARTAGADGVHPGYGFLAENADFAQACIDAGLVFVGPPPSAMRALGDKANARRLARAAGVPCLPGCEDDHGDEALLAAAGDVGFPLFVKAAAGGGGRGLRLVADAAALPASLGAARREAQAAFGDGRLLLERAVVEARHVEVQVFADTHGGIVHLGERDCTVQRRRQKLIEEAPSPAIDAGKRAALARDAIAVVRAAGYAGAGTVEFVVDADGGHHFLEVNTRLQVEHALTECLTGIDLVEWQLRVAAGEPLPLAQHEIAFAGHAVEARLYAEDPARAFAPSSGPVRHWRPRPGPGVRIDTGVAEGDVVTPHYDALLAKLVAHGRDRDDAVRRLARALEDHPLVGMTTNARLLRDLLREPAFAAAQITTSTLDEWVARQDPRLADPAPDDTAWRIAYAWFARSDLATLRPPSLAAFDMVLECGGTRRTLRDGVRVLARGERTLRFDDAGVHRQALVVDDGDAVHVARDGTVLTFREPSPWPAARAAANGAHAVAPVAGTVAQLLVAAGDRVVAGQPLASIEAMKIETWLTADRPGTVRAVRARPREVVQAGAVVVEFHAP